MSFGLLSSEPGKSLVLANPDPCADPQNNGVGHLLGRDSVTGAFVAYAEPGGQPAYSV
jgi:hypothetical protein